MARSRALPVLAAVLATGAVVATGVGLSGSSHPAHDGTRVAAPTSESPSTVARPAPAPVAPSCHRLSFGSAARPVAGTSSLPCRRTHTSVTYYVGRFDPIVDGHLAAVDSSTVQAQLARVCPRRLAAYVGGSLTDRRLSRFESVWFGPSVHQGDLGARWFRCDLVAIADEGTLADLEPRMRGVLDHRGALDTWGTCGTDVPSAKDFRRVICSEPHRWKAVGVVPFGRRAHYLGKRATVAANAHCKDVASNSAQGALKYTWSFEWPTRQQWDDGQRYGYCWLPSTT